jgi:hypothetical protein
MADPTTQMVEKRRIRHRSGERVLPKSYSMRFIDPRGVAGTARTGPIDLIIDSSA